LQFKINLNYSNLGRILALDYGTKRVGVAVTDPLQIIANGLTTVPEKEIWKFLAEYFSKEIIDCLVIGYPVQSSGAGSQSLKVINPFIQKFLKVYPNIPLVQADERYTSKMAHQVMIDGGLKKKDRQNKELVDTISATIILQWYLQSREILNLYK
jgi:putative Holliday junction resolvase